MTPLDVVIPKNELDVIKKVVEISRKRCIEAGHDPQYFNDMLRLIDYVDHLEASLELQTSGLIDDQRIIDQQKQRIAELEAKLAEHE